MMRTVQLLATLLLCKTAQAGSVAPWTRLGGPPGGDVGCFVFDTSHPGVTFAGSSGGFIYRSADGGTHWTRITVGRATEEFRVIGQSPAAPETFFAFSGGYTATGFSGRVYTSTDDGVTWALLPHQPTTSTGLNGLGRGIAIDSTGQIIVLSDHLGGIFRSTDGGESWSNPLPRSVARPFGLTKDSDHPGTLYFAGNTPPPQQAAIWKSMDFGATWVQSTPAALNGGPVFPLAYAIAVQPGTGTLMASYEGQNADSTNVNGLARSLNGGKNWTSFNTGILPDYYPGNASGGIVFDKTKPSFVYLADNAFGLTDGGLYRSGDNGGHWSPIGNLHPFGGGYVAATRPAMPGYPAALFVGYPGVTVSTDRGLHWTVKSFGNAALTAVADGGKPSLYFGLTRTNVVYSPTGGKSWALAGDWQGSHSTLALAVDLSRTTPAVFVSTLDNLWRSTDRAHWVSIKPPNLPAGAAISSLNTDLQGRLYATAGSNLVYRSVDDGETWTTSTVGAATDSFGGNTPLVLTNAPFGSPAAGRVYASLTSGLWVSNDYGGTWAPNPAQPDTQGGAFDDMAVQHVSPYALIVVTYLSGGLTVSTDGAATFTRMEGLPNSFPLPRLATAPAGPQVYADYSTSEVLLTSDNFTSFQNVAAPLMSNDSMTGALGSLSTTQSAVFVGDVSGATFSAPYPPP